MTPPKIYGLIGYPVSHSLSPLMHNAAFSYLKINAEYKLFTVKPEQLEGFLLNNIPIKDSQGESFFSQDIVGFNITIPHKVKAKEILEKEFPFDGRANLIQEDLHYVKLSGAVNTVKRDGQLLEYWNTDAKGFLVSLKADLKFTPENKKILIIGCGGAGRAITASLSWKNIGARKIYIYDSNVEAIKSAEEHFFRFDYVRDKIEFILEEQIPEKIKEVGLFVNASPVGMHEGDGSVIDKDLLHKKLSIYDIVYNRQTQLIKDAESLGLPCADGLGMLLYQGVASFEFWAENKAPIEIMRNELNKGVRKI